MPARTAPRPLLAAVLLLALAAPVLPLGAAPAVAPAPAADAGPGWTSVDYRALVDERALSHSGEPAGVLLERLARRPDDAVARALLEPLVEPYAFVLPDLLDALAPRAGADREAPFVELGSLWQPGAAQPAWAELLRARAVVLESDGRGRLRAFVPAGPGDASAEQAWRRAWPVVRHALAAERARLAAAGGRRPGEAVVPALAVDVHAFRHDLAASRFEVTAAPWRATVADTRPDGSRPPLDLAALRRFFEAGRQLEGGRLDAEGHLALLGSEPAAPPALLGRPVAPADLAVAWRAVAHGGLAEPYMSLDRGFGPQSALVNYGGRLRDTTLGLVSLLCDVRFKTFSQGLDLAAGSDARPRLRAALPGWLTHIERFSESPQSADVPGQQTRLWFYPDAVEVVLSDPGDVLALRRARMAAASERADEFEAPGGTGARRPVEPPWTKGLTLSIAQDYDALAGLFPELAALDQAARLLTVAAWLRDAQERGLPVPDLDALLALELPALSTPRRYPQLLAFDALPRAGTTDPVQVFDRAAVAAGLDRLNWPEEGPLPAERRFARALAALDRGVGEQAALARELESLPPRAPALLDAQAYRAERLRMHHLSLAGLPPAQKDPLARRARAGEPLRVFSVGIGGLDLGMRKVLARAARGTGRVALARGGTPAAGPAVPAVPREAGEDLAPVSAGPREAWRTDPAGLPVVAVPPHGPGAAGPAAVSDLAGATLVVYGADGPEPRARRVLRDETGRPQVFERLEEGRRLRYALVRIGAGWTAQRVPDAPTPAPAEPARPPEGLVLVDVVRPATETPALAVRLYRGAGDPLQADVPRAELQRVVLGREADLRPGQPLALLDPPPAPLAGVRTFMFVAAPARPPWEAPLAPVPGEEDAATLAAAFGRWWAASAARDPVPGAVVGTDRLRSAARWQAAPLAGPVRVLAPDDAFPPHARDLRDAALRGPALAADADPPVVVLVSAEPPAALAARVRALSRDPALRGRHLAVLSFAGGLRRDVAAAVVAEGGLAGLGLAEPALARRERRLADLAAFREAAARAKGARVESLGGPFTWFY